MGKDVSFDQDMIDHIGKILTILFGYTKDIFEDPQLKGIRLVRSRSEIDTELFNIYDLLELNKSDSFIHQIHNKELLDDFIKTKKKEML